MLLLTLPSAAQTQDELPPAGRTVERALAVAETHRYRLNLKADEFFQVRAEQKGADVTLKLLDAESKALATMDSPNGDAGTETLSFVASKEGAYVLAVSRLEGGGAKGVYTITREVSRQATARDRRRVEVERLFVEAQTAQDRETALVKYKAAQAGWRELSDRYMEDLTARLSKQLTAAHIIDDAMKLMDTETVESSREALNKLREANGLYAEVGDKHGEAETVFWMGSLSAGLGEKSAALQNYEKAAALLQELGDESMLATTFNNMGLIHYKSGEFLKALQYYERALPLLGSPDDKGKKALTLSNVGGIYLEMDEREKALAYMEQALPLAKESKDPEIEARLLNNLGTVYKSQGKSRQAIDALEQALRIRKAIGDEEGATNTAIVLAQAKAYQEEFGNPPMVSPLPVGRTVEGRHAGGTMGNIYTFSLKAGQVLRVDAVEKKAGVLLRLQYEAEEGFVAGTDLSLDNGRETLTFIAERGGHYEVQVIPSGSPLGDSYTLTAAIKDAATAEDWERIKAERLLDEAMMAKRERSAEGYRLAIAKWGEALPLWHKLGEKYWEAYIYNYIGVIYFGLGERQKALEFYRRALPLRRFVRDTSGEATTLSNMGSVYASLDERQLALQYYSLALPLFRRIGSKEDEAIALSNMGSLQLKLNGRQKALEYYGLALPLFRALNEKNDEAVVLRKIGELYHGLGEKEKAREYYNEALAIHRAMGDQRGEGDLLYDIGKIHAETDKTILTSFVYYTQSLRLARAIGDRDSEAVVFNGMMRAWVEHFGSPGNAILFGKQSVNKYQELRGAAKGLDSELQKTFLRSAEDVYKLLAELLIMEGRLEEAVQLLNLYQDQQFFDLDPSLNSPVRQLALSPREQKFAKLYETAGEDAARLGAELEELEGESARRSLSHEEETQRKKLDDEHRAALEAFRTFILDGNNEFSQTPDEQDRVPAVTDVVEMRAALRELDAATGQKTAALYTLVGFSNFYVLSVTADGPVKLFESKVERDDFNKKLLEFYALLQSPKYDPRPVGGELYEIIFKPAEAELEKAGVRNLMWMLDGALRYVPVAALWDGKRYLAERFKNVVFTRANPERMTRGVSRKWAGIGFGSSRAHTIDSQDDGDRISFPALPGVTEELRAIFRTGNSNAGTMDGEVFSDERFTKRAFYESLKRRRPLVHISSHFSFRPGDGSRSFLLLGDGSVLTLDNMKERGRLFDGVELLTLSACNTAATRADADGKEIDGFAELAQRLGAGSVLATLWQVSDNSTPWLMKEFYTNREAGDTKADALIKAQLALLHGTADAESFNGARKSLGLSGARVLVVPHSSAARQTVPKYRRYSGVRRAAVSRAPQQASPLTRADIVFVEAKNAPPFKQDERKPFSHPYFWSPFVLYGNGR